MSNLQSLSYLTANLAAGRNAQLEIVPLAADALPTQSGGGYPVTGAMLAEVRVMLRENAFTRTCYYVVDTVDLTAEYEVTIDGTTVTYDAAIGTPADLAELLADIAAAINANGTLSGAGFTATVAAYAGTTNDAVRITRTASTDEQSYGFDGTVDGTAVVSLYADASSANLSVLGRSAVSPSSSLTTGAEARACAGWAAMPNERGNLARSVGWSGYANPTVSVAGLAAVWPELTDIVGDVDDGSGVVLTARILVYPKRQESSS